MLKAIKEHYCTLDTTDEYEHNLAVMIHHMEYWLKEGSITKEIYIHTHDILRYNIGTENFLFVAGYIDKREENCEYSIRVVEFPEKSDGTIREVVLDKETGDLYLSSKEYLITKTNDNTK